MKFREYVGEKKVREVVKKKSALPKAKPKPKVVETYLGFGLGKKNLKRVFDYIKSWYIRYKVPFEPINPYLTVYLLENVSSFKDLMYAVKETKKGIIYKPTGTISIIGNYKEEDIVLNYFPNEEYNEILKGIFDEHDVSIVKEFCHVKLFKIKPGMFTNAMYYDMMYSIPPMPDIRLGNVGLLRRFRDADI